MDIELHSRHCLNTSPNSEESDPEPVPRIATIHTSSLPFEPKHKIICYYIHGPEPSLAILHGIQTSSHNNGQKSQAIIGKAGPTSALGFAPQE